MHDKMSSFDLDQSIATLLAEQPNGDKPVHRRRNKSKDLIRAARQNKPFIPKKVIDDILGEKHKPELTKITTMYVQYVPDEIYLGIVDGWYDDIKRIEKEMDAPPNSIRLENVWDSYTRKYIPEELNEIIEYVESCGEIVDREPYYEYESVGVRVKRSRAYQKTLRMNLHFFDEHDNHITSRGTGSHDICHMTGIDLPEGSYDYNQSAIDYVKKYFNTKPPEKTVRRKSVWHNLQWQPETVFQYDTDGKYKMYRDAAKERQSSRFWKKTYRQKKGNPIGKRNHLIKVLNEQASYGSTMIEVYDKAVLDYEFSHTEDIQIYAW